MPEITLNHITKIEGHASLLLGIENNKVMKCELQASEGSRYFEGILKGRKIEEAFEITSRICGICSVSHVVCSITAAENCLGIKPSKQTLELREAIMLGERVRSHTAHLFFLALPDYLGYESAISMAKEHGKTVGMALEIMNLGNKIVRVIGGRDMHPVTLCIGGFTKMPASEEISELGGELRKIRPKVEEAVKIIVDLKYPDFKRETQYASIQDKEFPIVGTSVRCGKTLFSSDKYLNYVEEYHEAYATANFVVKDDKSYMVGSLPRYNHSCNKIGKKALTLLKNKNGLADKNAFDTNPFHNNLYQAIELLDSVDILIKLCDNYNASAKAPKQELTKGAQSTTGKRRGIGVVEAPRGLLWHDYTINSDEVIVAANIITPTAQNLRNMQDDIRAYVDVLLGLKKSKEEIIAEVEKLIRAYDPCFSCATHFLRVKWEEK